MRLACGGFLSVFGVVTPDRKKIAAIVSNLLGWYPNTARDLPWRRTRDPYAIWVSEIMLQQTQVKAVIPYWERWMKALPTIQSLAKANPERIHKLWEGLGYYTRVRNMQKAARLIVNSRGGRFPTVFEEVQELPGVGRYTAGAVCSIAFNQPKPILDGNVIRVLTRVFGIEGNPRDGAVNASLWELADGLVKEAQAIGSAEDSARCSQLNQSLMELGALVCTPRQPLCASCPLSKLCVARKRGIVESLPNLPPRQAATKRRFIAFVAQREGKFLVRQRPSGVVNAHLWEFPNIEVPTEDGEPRKAGRKVFGIKIRDATDLCSIRHSITRYRIRLDVVRTGAEDANRIRDPAGRWFGKRELRMLPFASAHKQILNAL